MRPLSSNRSLSFTIGAQQPGIALVMTIIAIAGLTLLLVGLLTVLTLERKTARSYSDAARADLAVESGLAVSLASITEIAMRDDTIVFRLEDPTSPKVASNERPLGFREQFFTYGAIYEGGAWRGIPLFSGAPETSLGSREIEAGLLQEDLNAYAADAILLSHITEFDQNIPRAKWVEVPGDSSDSKDYTTRYAFWIEDLSGTISGHDAATYPRDDGRSTAELDYATILNPESETALIPPPLIAAKGDLRTSASIRPFFHGATEDQGKRLEPYINFLPPRIGPVPPKLIPWGFGYPDAGMPAHDLNGFVTDGDVDGIADTISRNLPNFEQRKGGFPVSQDYLKTLAASIIDYADADSDATTAPDFRGIDSYPLVNEMYDRYEVTKQTGNITTISVESYIEIWNMSQQQIQGDVSFKNINRLQVSQSDGEDPLKFTFTDADFPPQRVMIPPNGFAVLYMGTKDYDFTFGVGVPSVIYFGKNRTYNNFELRWNGVLVDTGRAGVERTDGYLSTGFAPGERKPIFVRWKGNGSPAHSLAAGRMADPRMTYTLASYINNHTYSSSNWGGRSLKRGINSPSTREVKMTDWPDRGSDSAVGIAPASEAIRPRTKAPGRGTALSDGTPYPPNQPEMAPARISNQGRYESTAELGNIFDPVQWRNIDDRNTYKADSAAGGGTSLAIGRPEYASLDRDGYRAAQLMDLFTANAVPTANQGRPINLNTAPREVLRSLLGGVVLDEDMANRGIKPPMDSHLGDTFADYVIDHRNSQPFRGFSDLNRLRRNPLDADSTAFFGSTQAYADSNRPPESWCDAGREELFKKVMGLLSFTSKDFRIVVTGETLAPDGVVVSRASREYHISIEPQRRPDGTIDSTRLPTIRKRYETVR